MAEPPAAPHQQGELTPRQIADSWKKQGGFDRLRKQLLVDFLQSVRPSPLCTPHTYSADSEPLTQPEKDALVAELDSLLPTLLSTTPSLARTPRQTRVAETASLLDKRGALNAPVLRLENRLQSGKGVGKTVERELKRAMCEAKGLPYIENPADLLAEKEEVAKLEVPPARLGAEPAAEPRDDPSPGACSFPLPAFDLVLTCVARPQLLLRQSHSPTSRTRSPCPRPRRRRRSSPRPDLSPSPRRSPSPTPPLPPLRRRPRLPICRMRLLEPSSARSTRRLRRNRRQTSRCRMRRRSSRRRHSQWMPERSRGRREGDRGRASGWIRSAAVPSLLL